ncbi:MAG TPA: (deoxy)nucleoside triphosphate pyrophosphohydrolase [Bacteroidales bacterium]|nr:(deoxy)nucleoside triphosphate pyrophosphohydrolase [Bacteroidales bacterium]
MIDVTCAIIRNEDEEILIVQRGENTDHPFKWEFPGGKIMSGESEEDCIIREIREELSMDIVICRRLNCVEYDYGKKQVRLIPFVCDTLDDVPFMSEHIAYKWVDIKDLSAIDFSEADVFVAGEYARSESAGVPCKSDPVPGNDHIDDEEVRRMINNVMGSKEADWMASAVSDNSALLKKLLDYSYSEDTKLAFHSSWILTKAYDKTPEIFQPFLPGIIESLPQVDNESALRSFLRILSLTDPSTLGSKHQGLLADVAFRLLNSASSAIAIKAYSMDILYRLTLIYPELATELALSVRALKDLDSAGVASKARNILKKLDNRKEKP